MIIVIIIKTKYFSTNQRMLANGNAKPS